MLHIINTSLEMFDFNVIENNKELRELSLADNNNLRELINANSGRMIQTLKLTNTNLEMKKFLENIRPMLTNGNLTNLDISGQSGSIENDEVCKLSEKLEWFNGEKCIDIRNITSKSIIDIDIDNESNKIFSSIFLITAVILTIKYLCT